MRDGTEYLTPAQYWEYRYEYYLSLGYLDELAVRMARADTDERY